MHRSTTDLTAMLPNILEAPRDDGRVEMLVRRPADLEREVVSAAVLDTDSGLVGDNWLGRAEAAAGDGEVSKHAQLTLMNARAAGAVANDRDRWPLCGDQVYVDMDISMSNLPAGSRLQIGTAVIEISAAPHTGCVKFSSRFGSEALRFVNTGEGKTNRLRGVNATVIENGQVSVGDRVKKL